MYTISMEAKFGSGKEESVQRDQGRNGKEKLEASGGRKKNGVSFEGGW